MKTLQDAIRLILISVIGSVLFLFIQKNYESAILRGGVQADAIAGPWIPEFEVEQQGEEFNFEEKYSENFLRENSVARIRIVYEGAGTMGGARLVFSDDFQNPDVLVFDKSENKYSAYSDVRVIELRDFKPGDEFLVFMRSSFGFGWPEYLTKVRLYTDAGEIPIDLHSSPTDNGYDDSDQDQSFIGFLLSKFPIIISVLGVFLGILALLGDARANKYIRKLLRDPEFLEKEKIRFSEADQKYFFA